MYTDIVSGPGRCTELTMMVAMAGMEGSLGRRGGLALTVGLIENCGKLCHGYI